MKEGINYRIVALLCIALLSMFVGTAVAGVYNMPRTAIYAALSGTFMTFIIFLDIKQDRILKGVYLIGAGVLYQLIYPKYLFTFVDVETIPADALSHFEIFGQVMVLACSGAGGSIIAVHADKTSSDHEDHKSQTIVVDNTRHIKQLIEDTHALHKKLEVLIAISVISVLTIIAIALFHR